MLGEDALGDNAAEDRCQLVMSQVHEHLDAAVERSRNASALAMAVGFGDGLA